ncbi:MAG TPA: DUF2752 domain-containing protein [Kiritimatiellia bacterium]|nr:DUF2752 domain-containing protein [Kiritimatiellia bacterium]
MPPTPSSRFAWGLLALVGLAAAALLFFFNPADHAFYPRCPLHAATGLDCPACGGLRAAHLLLHGQVRAAFALNPFLFFAAPCAALLLLPRKTPLPRWIPWAALAALLAAFLWRLWHPIA